jgi:hypothetical protein
MAHGVNGSQSISINYAHVTMRELLKLEPFPHQIRIRFGYDPSLSQQHEADAPGIKWNFL